MAHFWQVEPFRVPRSATVRSGRTPIGISELGGLPFDARPPRRGCHGENRPKRREEAPHPPLWQAPPGGTSGPVASPFGMLPGCSIPFSDRGSLTLDLRYRMSGSDGTEPNGGPRNAPEEFSPARRKVRSNPAGAQTVPAGQTSGPISDRGASPGRSDTPSVRIPRWVAEWRPQDRPPRPSFFGPGQGFPLAWGPDRRRYPHRFPDQTPSVRGLRSEVGKAGIPRLGAERRPRDRPQKREI